MGMTSGQSLVKNVLHLFTSDGRIYCDDSIDRLRQHASIWPASKRISLEFQWNGIKLRFMARTTEYKQDEENLDVSNQNIFSTGLVNPHR